MWNRERERSSRKGHPNISSHFWGGQRDELASFILNIYIKHITFTLLKAELTPSPVENSSSCPTAHRAFSRAQGLAPSSFLSCF